MILLVLLNEAEGVLLWAKREGNEKGKARKEI